MEVVNLILAFIGVVSIPSAFIFIPIGIVFLFKASKLGEQEIEKKKSLKKKGIIFILLPFLLFTASIIIGIVSTLAKHYQVY